MCSTIYVERKAISRKLIIWQSVFMSMAALLMCFPFGGYFIAPVTPIGVIYLSSLLLWNQKWPVNWYVFSCALSLAFLLANVLIIATVITNKNREYRN